jgi:ribosomal protein S18 acetylase RimI-like enzyme
VDLVLKTEKAFETQGGGTMEKKALLAYRNRRETDDPFIIRTTLETMKEIFEKATGYPLTQEMIRQQIQANDTVRMIVQKKQPVGFYMYTVFPRDEMYLSSLILVPSAQNRGMGTKVVRHIVTEGRKRGIRVITAHVQLANERALSFWKKNGFRVSSRALQGSVEIRRDL